MGQKKPLKLKKRCWSDTNILSNMTARHTNWVLEFSSFPHWLSINIGSSNDSKYFLNLWNSPTWTFIILESCCILHMCIFLANSFICMPVHTWNRFNWEWVVLQLSRCQQEVFVFLIYLCIYFIQMIFTEQPHNVIELQTNVSQKTKNITNYFNT